MITNILYADYAVKTAVGLHLFTFCPLAVCYRQSQLVALSTKDSDQTAQCGEKHKWQCRENLQKAI